MPKTIISDTSCFITLTNIGKMELLRKVYGEVYTTPEVQQEFGEPLPDWVIIQTPTDFAKQIFLSLTLDKGEASAIALALETPDCTIILDDYKTRMTAEQLRLDVTGTIGVFIKAKLRGIITSIKPYLEILKRTGFRFSMEIEHEALRQAGE